MTRLVATSLAPDGSKLISIDALGNLHVFSAPLWVGISVRHDCLPFLNPMKGMKGARTIARFVDTRILVIVSGCIAFIIDSVKLLAAGDRMGWTSCDPEFLLHRVGLPCMVSSAAAYGKNILLGTENGVVYGLNMAGSIEDTLRIGIPESISALQPIKNGSLIVGTDKGQILLFDLHSRTIKSSFKPSSNLYSVSCISVDPRENWFCASLNGASKSRLISGCTRTLVRVFESSIREGETHRCDFVNLASKGLCIVSSGPKSSVWVTSLDLESEPRSLHEGEGAVADISRTENGDVLAICGPGRPLQILSGTSLGLIRQLAVE